MSRVGLPGWTLIAKLGLTVRRHSTSAYTY